MKSFYGRDPDDNPVEILTCAGLPERFRTVGYAGFCAAMTSSSVFQNRGYDFATTRSLSIVTPPRRRPAIAKAIASR